MKAWLQPPRALILVLVVALLSLGGAVVVLGGDGVRDQAAGGRSADVGDGSLVTSPGSASTTTSTTLPVGKPTTMQQWQALWKNERDAVVSKIKVGGYGIAKDGQSALISEGYTIDLSKCPAGWNNTEGLTDTEIKIGHTNLMSGIRILASRGQSATGWKLYLDQVNKNGIRDSAGKTRTFNLIIKDDEYDASRTIPLVDEMIDTEQVFAMVTSSSHTTMRTYDKLNARCIPQPIVMSGHPAWGDPINHPWTTGEQMALHTEGLLWGAFIEERAEELKKVDGKITVAAIVTLNDFGYAYDRGFRAWLAQSPIKDDVEYVTEIHEVDSPTIVYDHMEKVASKNPEVFIGMTAGVICTQWVGMAEQYGLKEKVSYLFQPSVCKSNTFMGKDKVGGDGMASDGWWVVGGGVKEMESAAFDTDPWVKQARELLSANGIDWKTNPTFFTGAARWGWTTEQIFLIASQLDGGLTRVNLMVALRNLDMTAPFLLDGAKFNLNGIKDAYLTEASEFAVYEASSQSFQQRGKVFDVSGTSPNCVWSQQDGRYPGQFNGQCVELAGWPTDLLLSPTPSVAPFTDLAHHPTG